MSISDTKYFEVSPNMEIVAHDACEAYLWMDQICIDQESVAEIILRSSP
jgi:hypothetical protein